MMKDAFYFALKAFLLSRFKFLSRLLLGHVENSLISKIPKFMTSQPGW